MNFLNLWGFPANQEISLHVETLLNKWLL
jgi:hypothetical protein